MSEPKSVREQLDENISESVISKRQGGGGKSLSYLETWYVIDRLNQVLGQGLWNYHSKVEKVFEGVVNNKHTVHYIASVSFQAIVDGKIANFTDYGYGDGSDAFNPGKAHELAVKEAVSDGLKRCAKNLGRSMGLALYDKTQEFVGETVQTKHDTKIQSVEIGKSGKTDGAANDGGRRSARESLPSTDSNGNTGNTIKNSGKSRDTIAAAFSVLKGQKKVTTEEFKEKILKGKKLSELSEDEVNGVITDMAKTYPELKLKGAN